MTGRVRPWCPGSWSAYVADGRDGRRLVIYCAHCHATDLRTIRNPDPAKVRRVLEPHFAPRRDRAEAVRAALVELADGGAS